MATASVAAADVTFSGYGRFGAMYTGATSSAASNTNITSRYRLTVVGSTTTDSGVTFGAKVRMQQDSGDVNVGSVTVSHDGDTTGTTVTAAADETADVSGQNSFNAAQFYITSGGLTVRIGNIEGAFDSTAGLYSGSVGLTGLGYGNVVTGFATHDYADKGNGSAASQESIEVVYSMGDYTVHVSHNGVDTEIAGSATFSGVTVGLGTSTTDVATQAEQLATLGGSIGGVNLGLAYGKLVNGTTHTTLSMGMSVGAATSMSAYISDDEANTDKNYGVGLVHDLGAGTSLRGGVVSIDGDTRADFGVLFNF